jgi:hypothetical protein
MKKSVPTALAVICLFTLLSSFAFEDNNTQQYDSVVNPAKVEPTCFVQLNDGTIKQFTTLKLVTGVFKSPHLLADGNITITANEIIAYQDKEHFAVSQKEFLNGNQSNVAVNTLPGFAVRVATGRLNVYSLKYYNGHNTTEKLFLQSGDDGKIIAYNPEILSELIKDSNDAYNLYSSKKQKATNVKNLLAVVSVYNNSSFISKN